jgi:hypothetical protein
MAFIRGWLLIQYSLCILRPQDFFIKFARAGFGNFLNEDKFVGQLKFGKVWG